MWFCFNLIGKYIRFFLVDYGKFFFVLCLLEYILIRLLIFWVGCYGMEILFFLFYLLLSMEFMVLVLLLLIIVLYG